MRQRRHNGRTTWTLIGASVLLIAACGSDDDDENADTTQPERSTTSTESTTTTVVAEGPAEWIEVVRGINQRYFALLREPEPERVVDLYAESCECWAETYGTVAHLADENQHAEGQATSVMFVRLEGNDPASGFVDLTVKVRAESMRLVDANGEVVQELPADETAESCLSLSLLRDGPHDTWRVHDELPLTGCSAGS